MLWQQLPLYVAVTKLAALTLPQLYTAPLAIAVSECSRPTLTATTLSFVAISASMRFGSESFVVSPP